MKWQSWWCLIVVVSVIVATTNVLYLLLLLLFLLASWQLLHSLISFIVMSPQQLFHISFLFVICCFCSKSTLAIWSIFISNYKCFLHYRLQIKIFTIDKRTGGEVLLPTRVKMYSVHTYMYVDVWRLHNFERLWVYNFIYLYFFVFFCCFYLTHVMLVIRSVGLFWYLS